MREIKFRAWDIKNKKILPLLEITEDYLQTYSESLSERVIPMQFTGLKDKNGKEIYDKDILLVNAFRVSSSYSTWYQKTNKHHGEYEVKAVVVWKGAGWILEPLDKKELIKLAQPMGDEKTKQYIHFPADFYDRDTINICEVIGNVWENPELLKG